MASQEMDVKLGLTVDVLRKPYSRTMKTLALFPRLNTNRLVLFRPPSCRTLCNANFYGLDAVLFDHATA